jgi:hypothetical protein
VTLTKRTGGAEIRVVTTFIFDANSTNSTALIFVARLVLDHIRKANRVEIAATRYLAAGRFLAGAATSKPGAGAFCTTAMKVSRAKALLVTTLDRKARTRTKRALEAVEHANVAVAALIAIGTAATGEPRNT